MDDTDELIAALCTRIGMIMEDTSVVALTVPRHEPDELKTALRNIRQVATRISALIDAAEALSA